MKYLTPEATVKLKTVNVTAEATDGCAENGYRTETVSVVGAWEGRSLQGTPYSVNVFSEVLIENLQATTPDQVCRVNPTTQLIRGFTAQRTYRDGVPDDQYNHAATMEDTAPLRIRTSR